MGRFLSRALALLLVVAVLFVGFKLITGQRISLMGYTLLTVQGDGMAPTLPEGSLVVAKVLREDLRVRLNDIITFLPEGTDREVTRRVVELSIGTDGNERYLTQGDYQNAQVDPYWVRRDEIIGIYVRRVK